MLAQNAEQVPIQIIQVASLTHETDVEQESHVSPAQEREMATRIDANTLREYGVYIHDEEEFPLDESSERVPVPVLPSFPFSDKQYILVTDLQNVFNIREDYCLAVIAQNHEEHEIFLDDTVNKYALVDSSVKDSEYIDGKRALSMIFADARRYEETLPTEEEFKALQEQMGISGLGRDATGGSNAVGGSFVDLWQRGIVEDDENQKVAWTPNLFHIFVSVFCISYNY